MLFKNCEHLYQHKINVFFFVLNLSAAEEQMSSSQSTAIDIEPVNITDEEKEKLKISHEGASNMIPEASDRPFLDTVLSALDCSENDYLALLGLCLIYALANNKGNLNSKLLLIVNFWSALYYKRITTNVM